MHHWNRDMRIKNEWKDIRKGKALGCSDGSVVNRMCVSRTRVELLASILDGSQLPMTSLRGGGVGI